MSAVFKFTNRPKCLWYGKVIWLLNLLQQEFLLSGCMDHVLEIIESFTHTSSTHLNCRRAASGAGLCWEMNKLIPFPITFHVGKFIAQFNLLLVL